MLVDRRWADQAVWPEGKVQRFKNRGLSNVVRADQKSMLPKNMTIPRDIRGSS